MDSIIQGSSAFNQTIARWQTSKVQAMAQSVLYSAVVRRCHEWLRGFSGFSSWVCFTSAQSDGVVLHQCWRRPAALQPARHPRRHHATAPNTGNAARPVARPVYKSNVAPASGFEMCFCYRMPAPLVPGATHVSESCIKKVNPHLIYDGVSVPLEELVLQLAAIRDRVGGSGITAASGNGHGATQRFLSRSIQPPEGGAIWRVRTLCAPPPMFAE